MTTQADIYWSRRGALAETVERPDPVVWGTATAGPLTPRELERYDSQGFLFLESLLTEAELARCREEARRLAEEGAAETREDVIREPDSDAVRSVFRVHRTSRALREMAADPRLAGRARQILGGEVYIHQSRINFKPGFRGKEFYWHSDFETWHIEDGMPRPRALSMSILLSESSELNGPLMVIPGSHRRYVRTVGETPEGNYRRSLRRQEIGVPGTDALHELADRHGILAPKGPAGSVLLFDCNLLHGSGSNISPHPRNNVFIVYNSLENTLVAPFGGMAPRPEFLGERDFTPVGG